MPKDADKRRKADRVETKGRKTAEWRGEGRCRWTARVRLPSYCVTSSVTQSNEREHPHGSDARERDRERGQSDVIILEDPPPREGGLTGLSVSFAQVSTVQAPPYLRGK
ncbi:hypothetical protein K0M31_004043 [Melipona bicolor]|uniref:Uncharacterized protein n=1 Tax=Melipona bicolor TaxID=60889 RepID=A0AA40FY09_9HYME|nr:hypothetical protein K0M31_004043 [Melipona bicolor]